jgi:anaphase-promoting complex subunit 3
MVGKLWHALGDTKKAVDAYVAAVKVNPFLWEAFTGLCNTGKTRPWWSLEWLF